VRARTWTRISSAVRGLLRRARRLPRWALALLVVVILAAGTVGYQLARKPTEVLAAVIPSTPRSPARTWEDYGALFQANATAIVRPELLAALAQAESAGDPLASPPWTLRWSANPLDLYGPPSSAVGLLQMTEGNFQDARRLCVLDHEVARAGEWRGLRPCWATGLRARVIPAHSIEMTAAWLDESVRQIVAAQRVRRMTPERERRLAAVVHLCGRARAAEYARRGFWIPPGERCGDHDVARYVARVDALVTTFARLSSRGGG
jgi:hypothetical protein